MNRDRGPLLDICDALEAYATGEPARRTLIEQLAERATRDGVPSIGKLKVESDSGIRALTETSTAGTLLANVQPDVADPLRRDLYVRDVVTVRPAASLTVPFVYRLNPQATELGASGVPETQTKPDVSGAFSYQQDLLDVGVLAATITVTTQLWDDSPNFVSEVESELPAEVLLREEIACLTGNGETYNAGIVGVMNKTGVPATTAAAGSLIATLLKMYSTLAANHVRPDFAFVNSLDWASTLTATYSSSANAGLTLDVLDRVPFQVLPTEALDRGQAAMGDFRRGARLYERADVAITINNEHSDYRIRNLSLILGEERITFGVVPWRFTRTTGGSF